jgi:hypothetical protein
MSSLTASLSLAAELIEGHVDVVGANGVRWGGPVGVDHHLVALHLVGERAGVTWVRAQHKPDRRATGCPLDLDMPGLRITSIEHSSVGCS